MADVGNPNMKAGMPSVNPLGRPTSVFQSLSDRRSHWLKTLSRSQILAIADNDEKLDEYSSFDAQVLMGLAETLRPTPKDKIDPEKARNNLYDREIGRPTNKMELTGKDGDAIEYKAVGTLVDNLPADVRKKLLSALDDAEEK